VLGDMLEFFDYFLIGFVLAFIVGPWKLTFLQSAIVLLSSGVGAMLGAAFWGWMADRIGRRIVFNATILNFSLALNYAVSGTAPRGTRRATVARPPGARWWAGWRTRRGAARRRGNRRCGPP